MITKNFSRSTNLGWSLTLHFTSVVEPVVLKAKGRSGKLRSN